MSTENIDWSKAPEGAQAARVCGISDNKSIEFYSTQNGLFCYWDNRDRLWSEALTSIDSPSLIWKPKDHWSGEGLPPVGTACEWLDPGSDRWLPVEIVFLSSWVIVVRDTNPHPDGSVDLAFDLINEHPQFRAVRTAEQIEAEAREASIKQMMKDVCCASSRDIFEDLYDAGYRKVEGGAA